MVFMPVVEVAMLVFKHREVTATKSVIYDSHT